MTIPSSYPEIQQALLTALREHGGVLTTTEAYPAVTAKFPGITPEDLLEKTETGKRKWINRIQFARQQLIDQGLVDGSQRGIWKLREATSEPPPPAPTPEPPDVDSGPSVSQATIVEQLRSACHESKAPTQFEIAVSDAFSVLGFGVEQIGGSGDTDVLVRAILGDRSYSAVIDCKTSGKESIANSAINWPAINEHRQKHDATYAAVIGSKFASGNLQKFASDFDVRLIEVPRLIEVLEVHAKSPLTLLDLETLFAEDAGKAQDTLSAAARRRARSATITWTVLELLEAWAMTTPANLPVDAPTLRGALLSSSGADLSTVTLQELSEVLGLLTAEPLAVLKSNEHGAYSLTTSVHGARQRFEALARHLDS